MRSLFATHKQSFLPRPLLGQIRKPVFNRSLAAERCALVLLILHRVIGYGTSDSTSILREFITVYKQWPALKMKETCPHRGQDSRFVLQRCSERQKARKKQNTDPQGTIVPNKTIPFLFAFRVASSIPGQVVLS